MSSSCGPPGGDWLNAMGATGAVATRRAPGGAANAVSIRAASAAARCRRVPAAGAAGPVDAATVAGLSVLAREAPGELPGAVAEAQPAIVSADAETQPASTITRPASRRRLIRWMSHMPVRRRTRLPGSAGRLRTHLFARVTVLVAVNGGK